MEAKYLDYKITDEKHFLIYFLFTMAHQCDHIFSKIIEFIELQVD